jgi:competence protein ComEA
LAERNASRIPNNNFRDGSTSYSEKPTYSANRKSPLQLFDINKADSVQLMRIRGIGSKRASWILKYRNRLGGFKSTNQVSEVFGLDSATIDSVRKYTFVSPDFSPKKIYINTATVEMLGRHPYLNFKIAKAIVAFREQHGRFQMADDLLKIRLVTPETIRKIKPYLEF